MPSAPGLDQAAAPKTRISARAYLMVGLLAILAGAFYWFVTSSRDEEIEEPEETVRPSVQLSPSASSIRTKLGGVPQTITLTESQAPLADFQAQIRDMIVAGGQMKHIQLSAAAGGTELSPVELLDRLLVPYPSDLKSSLGPDTAIAVYGQRESFDQKGQLNPNGPLQKRLVLISEVKDAALLIQTLALWEPTMPQSFATLFEFDAAKASPRMFSDGTYGGASIRYMNFPYADKSLDYAIVPSGGKAYLVIAGSKEAIFSAVDLLK